MRRPETFDELIGSVYNTRNDHIFQTPAGQDGLNNMSRMIEAQWNAWEWGATAAMNALALTATERNQISRIPDSVAMRSLVDFTPLTRNMPRGTRS